ncbi:MAG: sigma-54-dependent Fis family transcriptional regulator [Acidobacteria bacterium]|nr:sigma-54-dependent Fis family transcriptional regulator [Acidobacteriota bacterium]
MHGNDASSAEAALKAGRFKVGLELLRKSVPGSSKHALLLAEALLRVGDWGALDALLARILESGPDRVRASALVVRGELNGYRGQLSESEADFQKAIELAISCSDRAVACAARIRMFAHRADISCDERTRRIAEETRDDALSLGADLALTAYHINAAKFEATQGRLSAASAHENLAAEHLRREPNYWQAAALALSRSCTAFLCSDLDDAVVHALEAGTHAQTSGDLWSQAAAAANLGCVYMYRGQFEAAEEHLVNAKDLGRDLPVLQLATLDSLAQLWLLRGHSDRAAHALAQVAALISLHPPLRDSWYELATIVTRTRLHRTRGLWNEALHEADAGCVLSVARGDDNSTAVFHYAAAEALAMRGEIAEGAQRFMCALAMNVTSNNLRVERNRVRSTLHSANGNIRQANEALALSERLARAMGDQVASAEVRWTKERLRRVAPDTNDAAQTEYQVSLLWPLLESADTPLAFAEAALDFLATSRSIDAAAIVSSAGGHDEIVKSYPLTSPPAIGPSNRRTQRIEIAPAIALEITPANDFEAHYVISSIRELLLRLLQGTRRSNLPESSWLGPTLHVESPAAFESPVMTTVIATARRVAPLDVTVLLTGETGVGKEVLARLIHDDSGRAKGPFVPFNCSAVPREMLESQLFGYRKGAFTGAGEAFPGVIRSAETGTLFLDEVGELPIDLQPKLLRFLESREVHPLGEPKPVKVDVRVIAATNADISARIQQHQFREDLFYRLNTVQLEIPPLRTRAEEIPRLAQLFLVAHAEEFRKGHLKLASSTLERLLAYNWPGNIRELSNEMRRVAALAEPDSLILPVTLSQRIIGNYAGRDFRSSAPAASRFPVRQHLPQAVSSLERTMIINALEATGGRVDEAARLLGISRKGLFLKRKRYGITGGTAD